MPDAAVGAPVRLTFDTGDRLLAAAAWSRLAEPGDVVAGALVAALGAGPALDWVAGAVGRPGEAARELARLEPGARVARELGGPGAGPGVRHDPGRRGTGVPAGVGEAGAGEAGAAGHGTGAGTRAPGVAGADRTAGSSVARSTSSRGSVSYGPSPAGVLMAGVRRWASRLGDLAPGRDIGALERMGGTLLVPGDARWPAGLDGLGPTAPFALWVRGRSDLAGLTGRAVSLVGSRASTGYGERAARDLSAGLVRRGFTVVSGGAYGIDTEAHRAALTCGGPTLVLLASGVDRLYPAGNRRLMEAALEGGAVVAEVPPGATPFRQRFLARNRIIAAFGSATVVIEAAVRSGALSTANHATRLLRPLGAVPGPITSMASAGCHELLRSGAAVCVTDAAEAAELAGDLTGDAAAAPQGERRGEDGLGSAARRVLDALPVRRGAPPESVARVAGLAVDETIAELGGLLLEGLAEREGVNWRRAPR